MSGSKFSWSSLNTYFASYLYYNGNPGIKPSNTYLLMPCTDFINNCVLTLGVKIGNKIGVRPTILLTLAFNLSSCLLMICSKNFYAVLIAMGLLGVGSGFGYFTPITNCWKYYPNNNGLVFGIIVAGLGLSSSMLTPLADYFIVNPEGRGTNKEGYYEEDVANNLRKFLYVLTGIFAFLGTIAFFVTFPFEEEQNNLNLKNEENEPDKEKGETEGCEEKDSKKDNANNKQDIDRKDLYKIFFSKKNLIMLGITISGLCKYLFL